MFVTITGNADTFANSLPFDEFIERLEDVAKNETDRGIVRRAIRLLRRYENEQPKITGEK